jgi:hypothetical protein
MVNKLLIYLLAGLVICSSLAETEKDDAPVKRRMIIYLYRSLNDFSIYLLSFKR